VKDSIKVTAAASLLAPLTSNALSSEEAAPYLFTQIALPYAFNALEPNIDAMTMEIHYTKHHAAYIKNVNEEIAAGKFYYESEKDFFTNASKLSTKAKNNSGGAWNHNFFWQIMKPNGGGAPSGKFRMPSMEPLVPSINSKKNSQKLRWAVLVQAGRGWLPMKEN